PAECVRLSGTFLSRFGTSRAIYSTEELRMKRKKLGEILQERGQISAADLQQLFKDQEGKMVRLGELILERGLVDKPSLVKALEEVSRVQYVDCTTVQWYPSGERRRCVANFRRLPLTSWSECKVLRHENVATFNPGEAFFQRQELC